MNTAILAVLGMMIGAFVLPGVALGQAQAVSPAKEIRITGRVVDPSGAVISFATVTLKSAGGEVVATVRTENNGKFEFVAAANRVYQLLIEAPGFQPVQKAVEGTAGQDVEVPVIVMNSLRSGPDLVIAADVNPAIISGLVTDPSGAVIPDATVKALLVESTGTKAATQTDPSGRYTFSVIPGRHDLRFERLGFVPKTVRVTAEPGSRVDVSVVLEVGSLVDPIFVPFEPPRTPPPLLQAQESRPISRTLCEVMKEPERFNGKMVRFRATVVSSLEVFVLKDDSCSDSIWLSIGEMPALGPLEYAYINSIADIRTPERLDWKPLQPPIPVVLREDRAYRRLVKDTLKQFKPKDRGEHCVHCPLYIVTATVTGRFDHTDRKWRMVRGHDTDRVPSSLGFGHMNSWDSQLVLQSVSDVVAKSIDPSVYEKRK